MSDPFKVKSAEVESAADIGHEFVEDHTEYAKLAAYDHTIAWGSRGSGKTMHLRYLEPAAWMARNGGDSPAKAFGLFLESGSGYVGVYINCREAVLSRAEFRLLSQRDDPVISVFADRYLGQVVILAVASTFATQLPGVPIVEVDTSLLPKSLLPLGSGANEVAGILLAAGRQAHKALDELRTFADRLVLGLSLEDAERQWLISLPSLGVDVDALVNLLHRALGGRAPVFLMFDEANELARTFQSSVAGLLARRSQRHLCLKVGSQLLGFSPGSAQAVHDFVDVDLDALYTNNQDAYHRRVRQIASARLKAAGINIEPEEYLPENPADVARRDQARQIAGVRYDSLPQAKRPESRTEYIKKYAPAIVHQELTHAKSNKSYAGFDNIVHLSSGIVRAFLDCCSSMHVRYTETYNSEPSAIPVSIQSDVVDAYSDRFLEAIQQRIDGLREEAAERQTYVDVQRLLTGLGMLYRLRLMDSTSREPRIISFSLKDDPSQRLASALRCAEQEAYLHKVWYRSKRGTRKLPCYVFNRRLCPHFGLDLLGFQGRIELSTSEVEMALDDPDRFAKVVSQRSADPDTADGQGRLWEW